MGFKEFCEFMDKPVIEITTYKHIEEPKENIIINTQMANLIEENRQLRKQLKTKKINAIETKCKLLE